MDKQHKSQEERDSSNTIRSNDTSTMEAMKSALEAATIKLPAGYTITRTAKKRYLHLALRSVECIKIKDVPFVTMATMEKSQGDADTSEISTLQDRICNNMAYMATLADTTIDDITRLKQIHNARSEEINNE